MEEVLSRIASAGSSGKQVPRNGNILPVRLTAIRSASNRAGSRPRAANGSVDGQGTMCPCITDESPARRFARWQMPLLRGQAVLQGCSPASTDQSTCFERWLIALCGSQSNVFKPTYPAPSVMARDSRVRRRCKPKPELPTDGLPHRSLYWSLRNSSIDQDRLRTAAFCAASGVARRSNLNQ
jgi:hypothetical protein